MYVTNVKVGSEMWRRLLYIYIYIYIDVEEASIYIDVGEACIHTHTYTHTHTHTHTHIVSVAVHVRERRLGHKAVVSPLHDVPSREYMPRVGWHRYIKKIKKYIKPLSHLFTCTLARVYAQSGVPHVYVFFFLVHFLLGVRHISSPCILFLLIFFSLFCRF
jgi:hypothetical protein